MRLARGVCRSLGFGQGRVAGPPRHPAFTARPRALPAALLLPLATPVAAPSSVLPFRAPRAAGASTRSARVATLSLPRRVSAPRLCSLQLCASPVATRFTHAGRRETSCWVLPASGHPG